MAEKVNQKERLKEITDSIETGIQELFNSEKYTQYLKTMSRFHKYSLNNTLLIALQDPNATAVCGFNKWKDQFSRNVKKGEKGIKIIAPTPYKIKEQRDKIDPQTKAPMLDSNGKVQTEEVEKQIPMFRVVSVFDVAQTEGKELPTLATDLIGNVEQFEVFIEALKRSAPVPIAFEKMGSDTDGYYHTADKRIAIREGMSEIQTISATVHEIAHSKLHDREQQKEIQAQTDEKIEPIPKKSRATEEVEAESISFAVCNYYGIETGENSLGYIANWSKGKELKELKSSLETINKTSSELITDIDHHFAEIVKERGIDLTPEVAEPSEVDILATSIHDFIMQYKGNNIHNKRVSIDEITENITQGKTEFLKEYIVLVGDKLEDKTEEARQIVMLIDEYADRNYPTEIAYQTENTYVAIQTIEGGHEYSCYDKDFNLIDGGEHDDPEWTIYDVARDILSVGDVPPFANLDDFKQFDYAELVEKADNVAMSKIVGTIKYSDVTSEFVASSPNFIDRDMPLYTNIEGDKYVLGFGDVMSGDTLIWNYLEEVDGDYKTVAQIDTLGNIYVKDDNIPDTVKAVIENHADYIKTKNIPVVENEPIADNEQIANNEQIVDDSKGIEVLGHEGTWYVVDNDTIDDTKYFLLEHEEHGDMAACVIVDGDGKLLLDEVWNGFDDLTEHLAEPPVLTEQQQEMVANLGGDVLIAHSVGAGKAPPTDYLMPDPTVSIADSSEFGYTAEELLPLSKDRATELFNNDLTIFALHPDNTEAMIFDIEEIDSHGGLFGIEKVDWESCFEFKEMQNQNQEVSLPLEKEQEFIDAQTDSFAIYQLKNGDNCRDYRFEGMNSLTARGLEVDRGNYNLVYSDGLQHCTNTEEVLNALFLDFNQDKPLDYSGRSLSVSDIIALKLDGVVTSHYVDSFGFKEVENFIKQDNPLATAEKSTEQNYNMIDGQINNTPTIAQLEQDVKDGKAISMMDLIEAQKAERNPKQSVIDQLRAIPQEHKKEKTAPSKGAEMER